jgi:hypothetical protein
VGNIPHVRGNNTALAISDQASEIARVSRTFPPMSRRVRFRTIYFAPSAALTAFSTTMPFKSRAINVPSGPIKNDLGVGDEK